jgi:catalase
VAALDPKSAMMLQEAFRHHKALGAWGSGADLLATAVDTAAPGIVTGEKPAKAFNDAFIEALGWHRHWER